MPTYEYSCEACGHQFEAFQSIAAEPLRECPECGGAVKRLINGGIGLIFKGSGFYLTDYARSNGTKGKSATGSTGDGKKEESASTKNKDKSTSATEAD